MESLKFLGRVGIGLTAVILFVCLVACVIYTLHLIPWGFYQALAFTVGCIALVIALALIGDYLVREWRRIW